MKSVLEEPKQNHYVHQLNPSVFNGFSELQTSDGSKFEQTECISNFNYIAAQSIFNSFPFAGLPFPIQNQNEAFTNFNFLQNLHSSNFNLN